MTEKTNFFRNISSDENRINCMKTHQTLKSIFTSAEYRTLRQFVKVMLPQILTISSISFFVALMEGSKAGCQLKIINGFVSQQNLRSFLGVFAVYLSVTLISSGVRYVNLLISRSCQLKLMRNVRNGVIEHLLKFDIGYFDHAKSGELIFLMNSEASRFANLVMYMEKLFSSTIQAAIFVSILFYMSFDITLLVFVASLIFFKFHLPIDFLAKRKSWELNMLSNKISHIFHQIVYGMKIIKIGGCEEREHKKYIKAHIELEESDRGVTKLNGLSSLLRELSFVAVFLIVFGYIFLFGKIDALKAGTVLAYLFMLIRTFSVLSALQESRTALIISYGPLARVMGFLAIPLKTDNCKAAGHKKIDSVKTIELKNVTFSYDLCDRNALDCVNLKFEAGKMYALVGPSGSGKSTILDILSSVRKPIVGDVFIDDVPISHINDKSYHALIGYVNQDPIMFHDTIGENVAYFVKSATPLTNALKNAEIETFIKSLPDGLNTPMGERGLAMSGGQRQRIGIARVFIQNTPVLLLDEATNALDYKTENKIYSNLEKMKGGKIIIVAAHRLSTLTNFDRIIVMQNGRIHEQGNHTELMGKKTLYRELYTITNGKDESDRWTE